MMLFKVKSVVKGAKVLRTPELDSVDPQLDNGFIDTATILKFCWVIDQAWITRTISFQTGTWKGSLKMAN